MNVRATCAALLGLTCCTSACRGSASSNVSSLDAAGATPVDASASALLPRERELIRAENIRSADEVLDADLGHASAVIRRAAARTLARIAQTSSVDRLIATLADGDPEVMSWAAFGLGQLCDRKSEITTRRLVARMTSLEAEPFQGHGDLDPARSIVRALGQCADASAERVLVTWLQGRKTRSAVVAEALGDIASRNRRIEEESSASLLQAAVQGATHEPVLEALYPFGRLRDAPARARERLLEVTRSALKQASPSRVYAIRALGRLGEEAIDDLKRVLVASDFAPVERVEAARSLGRISKRKAQEALVEAVLSLAPSSDPVALTSWVGPGFAPLLVALEVLEPNREIAKTPGLRDLAGLAFPPNAPKSLERRIVRLRCAAARLVAMDVFDDPVVTRCDSDPKGLWGALARIAVLGRAKIEGARVAAYRDYLRDAWPPRVREEALRLLDTNGQIEGTATILADALHAKDSGVVAVAAEQLAAHPDRVLPKGAVRDAGGDGVADAVLVRALVDALQRDYEPDALDTRVELAKAAGALGVMDARSKLETWCRTPNPELYREALSALKLLGGGVSCEASRVKRYDPASELDHLVQVPVKLRFETDVGPFMITLDPAWAPVAVTRVVDLVRRGFFDGMAVHRVVPGFVFQFGDKGGDSYGGAGLEPLRCELSPLPFQEGVVGMALSGKDTGSSQLFVALSSNPHLDGRYAVVGKAEGPLHTIAEGDVIQRVIVER